MKMFKKLKEKIAKIGLGAIISATIIAGYSCPKEVPPTQPTPLVFECSVNPSSNPEPSEIDYKAINYDDAIFVMKGQSDALLHYTILYKDKEGNIQLAKSEDLFGKEFYRNFDLDDKLLAGVTYIPRGLKAELIAVASPIGTVTLDEYINIKDNGDGTIDVDNPPLSD